MSVLLVGVEPALARALIPRLLEEGDQVRAVVAADEDAAAFAGAHVATGDAGDDDLVERAAQGARTIVLGGGAAVRAAALEGAARAGVDRAVLIDGDAESVPGSMSWVLLVTRRRIRRGPPIEAVAEAVDAADDMAGEPRLTADLTRSEGWAALGLTGP